MYYCFDQAVSPTISTFSLIILGKTVFQVFQKHLIDGNERYGGLSTTEIFFYLCQEIKTRTAFSQFWEHFHLQWKRLVTFYLQTMFIEDENAQNYPLATFKKVCSTVAGLTTKVFQLLEPVFSPNILPIYIFPLTFKIYYI